MLSRSINHNYFDCYLYRINFENSLRATMIVIIFTKFFLIFLPLDGTLKIAFLNQKAVNLRCLSYFSEQRRC